MRAGFNNVEARLRDLDAEGVRTEILFPQRSFGFNRIKDLEYREWCYRACNQHLAEACAQQPDRLYGVAILMWWELRANGAVAVVRPGGDHLLHIAEVGAIGPSAVRGLIWRAREWHTPTWVV